MLRTPYLAFLFGVCLAVGACKPDITRIREHIPDRISGVTELDAVSIPFVCTIAIFSTSSTQNDIAKISGLQPGPISDAIPENSAVYRAIKNVERGCQSGILAKFGIDNIADYLGEPNVYFTDSPGGTLVIIDPARGIIFYMEG